MQKKLKLGLLATLVSAFLASNAYAIEMVHLEGGKFLMGSAEDVRQRGADETLHEVSVSPFYLSPTEVSQAQYQEIMGENPSFFEGSELPVENVDFYKALEFCNRLSVKEGLEAVYSIDGNTVTVKLGANGYRLPTEAEWEYAARALSTDIFNNLCQKSPPSIRWR